MNYSGLDEIKTATVKNKILIKPLNILIIDDSKLMLKVLDQKLKPPHYLVHPTPSVAEALKLLASQPIDIVITDKMMPEADGLDIIRVVHENHEETGIIMITGYATLQGAVEAVKQGADEYLEKPVQDDALYSAIERVADKINRKKLAASARLRKKVNTYGIIGESPAMQKVFDAMNKVAAIPATVLLTGDSGTGKELVARAIHYNSPRAHGPFVAVNCSAIPETLLESELFGSLKGAYTGSTSPRHGYFATAEGGTILLDEISSTSLALQTKLLRVVQEKEVIQVGADLPKKVDVKIITATNKNLDELMQKGLFRDDLYYRLNVLSINLPPLVERGDDVFILLNHFVSKYADEYRRPIPTFTDGALQAIAQYVWPGNVRELENLVQRLIVMTDSTHIDVSDLPKHMRFSLSATSDILKSLGVVEREHISRVLESVNGNKTRAAEILGIDRKTLRAKLSKTNSL
ncbi:sigma-54-dependent Fis family transcriptional regulator [candidate division KSB1 bacterium]|nr:sigma-54-dependent Fis family transcriptional regulator [candidate division KSB1 bacterium]RQW01068.1 MAG: sigma-54-dependent Fis family transcriptional regulator [candidate division KSB1 bacterium]